MAAQKRPSKQRSGNPARRNQPPRKSPPPPSKSNFRTGLERFSAPILIRLHAMPRWILPVVMGLALTAGLFVSGPWAWLGAVLLVFIALFLVWMFVLAWPVLSPGAKFARILVVAGLLGMAALKAMGRL